MEEHRRMPGDYIEEYSDDDVNQRIASDYIDDYVNNVALEMEAHLSANPITKERLRKIKGTNTYANSLNVFVGR